MGKQIEETLTHTLKELHLPAIRECYREQSEIARAESFGYEQYLLGLTDQECEAWRQRDRDRWSWFSSLDAQR